jgi:transcriptional regulator with XRE-family HTH domain
MRAARKAHGLSYVALAGRSEVLDNGLGIVERSTTSRSIESLKAIAAAMHRSLGILFAGDLRADFLRI